MQQRERGAAELPHPHVRGLVCLELEADTEGAAFGGPWRPGLPLSLDMASGEARGEAAPALRDVRGGLFADEPGLGKTVTAVSRAACCAAACHVCGGGLLAVRVPCLHCAAAILAAQPQAAAHCAAAILAARPRKAAQAFPACSPVQCLVPRLPRSSPPAPQIALVLRSLGTLPAAPDGMAVTWVSPRRGYYCLPREAAATATQLLGSRGTRSSLRRSRSSGAGSAAASAGEQQQQQQQGWQEDDITARERHIKRLKRSPSAGPPSQEGAAVAAAAAEPAAAEPAAAPPAPGAAGDPTAAAGKAGEGGAVGGAAGDTWLQCDLCQKWRRLPAGYQVRPLSLLCSIDQLLLGARLASIASMLSPCCPAVSLPHLVQAPEEGEWACAMNPDEGLRWQECAAPQQAWDTKAGMVTFCPG